MFDRAIQEQMTLDLRDESASVDLGELRCQLRITENGIPSTGQRRCASASLLEEPAVPTSSSSRNNVIADSVEKSPWFLAEGPSPNCAAIRTRTSSRSTNSLTTSRVSSVDPSSTTMTSNDGWEESAERGSECTSEQSGAIASAEDDGELSRPPIRLRPRTANHMIRQ